VGYDRYNGTAHVHTTATIAVSMAGFAVQNAESPLAPMHLSPVAAAADTKHPANNHKCTLAATVGSNFCGYEQRHGRHGAKGAQRDPAIEVDDKEGKWLGSDG
jgi:hypothetical protein